MPNSSTAQWPEHLAQACDLNSVPAGVVESLSKNLKIPLDIARTLVAFYMPLAAYCAGHSGVDSPPFLLGVNGAQGTGKSTAAQVVQALLQTVYDKRVCAVSIDDLYLGRAARQTLSAHIHPLLATRGVPGTHDLPLALRLFKSLKESDASTVTRIPRFNKALDDCVAQSEWDCFTGKPDVIIFEGWCVGARPQRAGDLQAPVNNLEAHEDNDGAWRRYVNDCLRDYQLLFDQIDLLVMLKAPSFDQVLEWRQLQEEKLRASLSAEDLANSKVMSADEIGRFIAHYERLTRWMLGEMPARADVLLTLGKDHQIATIKCQISE
ncbi:phosphoribulokinase [Gilvimarinus sp. SDUM040013]|uniref:Phosphoribulokinase n=1 Tax=Gilvimarinus gilvus TaxID=3058038 RepID=A0ABU4RT48_9GAMM|nr:phosphoribulokinase [Gilvimarinus sp. SDUM040013]MDO3387039.1 phosphoribulokinase [Gilvimarinus sp. SDUM040013]MDX6848067.1 phosphoribulokinase [Gilvimarinus sp. SDUM040013]